MRILLILACVLAAALIALSTWLGYWAANRNDEYQLILLGKTVYDGGRMYVDCWENKPPGTAWINAAAVALTGGRQLGAWVCCGMALGLAAVWGILAAQGTVGEAWRATFAFNQQYAGGDAYRNSTRGLNDLYPLILPLWLATVGLTGPLRA